MKFLLIALVALLPLCPAISQAQDSTEPAVPFHISSFGTPFAMQGDFVGEYRIHPDSIEVAVTRAVIRISDHCPYKGRRLLSSIQFGLSTETEKQRWKIASKSEEFLVGSVMSPNDEYTLGPAHFSIPKETSTDLSKHWLVVQLEDVVLDVPESKQKKGYAFAHSCRDIFTKR
ncbi:MAG TPA: hypothetical protein VD966_00135 [Pyrinomonadaceae bacterium]|nr:hypothetical protein [Pyrinomonadaceae bacterium]